MNKKLWVPLALLVIISLACSISTGGPATGVEPSSGGSPVPEVNSPGFNAQANSPESVLLSWEPIDGATGYRLEYSWDGEEFYPLAELPAEATQYEDLLALPESTYTYRLQAVTAVGEGDWLVARVTTGPRQPNPLTVQPVYDEAAGVSATIAPEGGSLSLQDSRGVLYTLEIPSGALAEATEIRLIPVTTIDRWPLDGDLLAAVRIEPEGLQLYDAATLSLEIPVMPDPGLATVGFAFAASGEEFHLQQAFENVAGTAGRAPGNAASVLPALQTRRTIILPTIELRPTGVGQASPDRAAEVARDNPPSNASDAMDQDRAASSADPDLEPLVHPPGAPRPQSNNSTSEMVYGGANKLLDVTRAAQDCNDLNSAIVQFQRWNWQKDRLSTYQEEYSSAEDLAWDELTDKAKEILEQGASDCRESGANASPAGTDCLRELMGRIANPPATQSGFWLEFSNKMDTKVGREGLNNIHNGLHEGACSPYQAQGYYTGVICSLERPFTVVGNGLVGLETWTFSPQTYMRGTATFTQDIQNCHVSASGPYTIEFYSVDGEGGITATLNGTSTCAGVSIPFQTTLRVRIDRADPEVCR